MASTLPTRSDLAQAINAGLSLYEMGQRLGHPSLTIARLLYGHYTQAVSLAELENHALYHYMSLRRDATRLCQKNGLSPLAPRKEDLSVGMPRSEARQALTREYLAEALKTKTIAQISRENSLSEATLYAQLNEYRLSARQIREEAGIGSPQHRRRPANANVGASVEAHAHQSPVEAPGAITPPETSNEPSGPSADKPAPESVAGRGVAEGVAFPPTWGQVQGIGERPAVPIDQPPAPTFAAQIGARGIDITLADRNLTPAEVRQYLRVAEGPLELAGDGLELSLTIRGPRR
ncbi:MAG: hypothetical protein ACYC5Y_05160 [Symbiobacteriia bacterium]